MSEHNQEPTHASGRERGSGPAVPLVTGAVPPAPAGAAWPDLPPVPAEDPAGDSELVADPAVTAVLARLANVPQTPVSGHGELYAGMHDGLLEALNEDVTAHAGVARRIHAAGGGGS